MLRYTFVFCLLVKTTWAEPINLQQPPVAPTNDLPKLSSPLRKENGTKITTIAAWKKQRDALQQQWWRALGLSIPKKRVPLKTEFLQTEELPGFTRQLVRYQIEAGVYTDGYLLTPKNTKGKLPAVIVFHPTTALQAKGVAGLAPEYAEEKQQGLQLVERGYVVWCPRNFIFDEGTGIPDGIKLYTANVKHMQQQHPQLTGMGRMVLDAVRAADFVESLPLVDQKRIGGIGHSLGGKQVLYAAAFDERYQAVVSSEGGIGFKFSNWEAPWYLGPQVKNPAWTLENNQVLAMVAPRAFLLLAGDFADTDKSWSFIVSAKEVYTLYGKAENIGWFDHHLGHRYAPVAREVAEAFLDEHLKKK